MLQTQAMGRAGTVNDRVVPADGLDVEALYRTERLGLLRLAVLLVGDRGVAEDVVQDAFMALQRRWSSLADPAAAAGYLRVSVVNGSRSIHRHRLVAQRHLRAAEPVVSSPAEVAVLLAEEHRAVVTAVRRLPRRQREVLILRYWSDLSEAQIAETLGVSRGTVKSSASRALKSLGLQLGVNNGQ